MVLVRGQGLRWHVSVTISNLHFSLSGWEDLSPFYIQETEAQRVHDTGQDHTASECSMSISSMWMSRISGMEERAGPGSSSRSGAELELKSTFPSPENLPEPLV